MTQTALDLPRNRLDSSALNAAVLRFSERSDPGVIDARPQPTGFVLTTLMACVLLQRFVIPLGPDMKVPVATPIVLGVAMLELAAGRLRLNAKRFLLFSALVATALLGLVLHNLASTAPEVSFASLANGLLVTAFATLTFETAMPERKFFRYFTACFGIVAVASVLQFVGQFFGVMAFEFSGVIPKEYLLEGDFTTFQPIAYGVDIFRSNGFFLAEPSLVGQFMAVAVMIEILCECRVAWLMLYIAAMIVAVSGTGMLVLAAFVAPMALWSGRRGLLMVLVMAGIAVVAFFVVALAMPDLVNIILVRSGEFSDQEASGNARFIGAFAIVVDAVRLWPWAIAIGTEPGIADHLDVPYLYLPNTATKYIIEYGILGFTLYLALILSAQRTSRQKALLIPMLVLLLLTGQYQQFSPIVFPVLLIITVARLREAT